jgi:hypothetical protein
MSTAYVQYHRQPQSKYLSIAEYNQKFGSNIANDHEYEAYFQQAYKKARAETGMGEFIQQNFRKPDSGPKYMPPKSTSQVRPRVSYVEPVASPVKRSIKNEPAVAFEEEAVVIEDVPRPSFKRSFKRSSVKHAPNLSDFLNDEELEVLEEVGDYEEMEELMEEAAPVKAVARTHTLEDIDNYVHANAKDANAFARDKQHLIVFKTQSDDLGEKLMKGRARYLERLKQYTKGDTSVKVRMMSGKEVLVSSLKPNTSSLLKMLNATSGAPRFCDCNC